MSIQVSVVVPTYKRPQLLRKCLYALIQQNFTTGAYEVVVVDDAASDETRALVEQLKMECASSPEADSCVCIRYAAAIDTQGPAAARNIGWRMARGEIIAFTDDDCLPEPDWLKEGIAAFHDDLAGVSGRVIVPISDHPTDYEKNVSRLSESEFVTANCFYRRSALESVGGFDERFTMAWREDSDLQFKLLALGCKLGRAPAARVIHPVRPAAWGISIKEQRKSLFDALLFKKYPDIYRRLIASGPPLRYYGIIFSSLGILAALWVGAKPLAFLLLTSWSGLVLHFAFQRLQNTKHTPAHILEMLFTSAVIPYLSVFWRIYGAFYYRVFFF